MKKLFAAVGASVALLSLWLHRKYKTVVEEGQRRQGRGVPWASHEANLTDEQ